MMQLRPFGLNLRVAKNLVTKLARQLHNFCILVINFIGSKINVTVAQTATLNWLIHANFWLFWVGFRPVK